MLKLETLRVFQAVVEARGLAEAADRLGRTPGALSMTLRDLEDRLGGRLFATDRKTRLTPLGEFVYAQAQRSVEGHDRAVSEILRFARGEAGMLRVAAVPSIASKLLPVVFTALSRRAPELCLELRDIDSKAVINAVRSGEVELGLASAPTDDNGLLIEPLLDDPFVVVCRRDSALAALQRPVDWPDLHETSFIANGLCWSLEMPEIQALVARASLNIHNVWSLLAFVEAGHGATLLPAYAAPQTGALTALPLHSPAPNRRVCILSRKDRFLTPSATLFLELLRRITTQLDAPHCDDLGEAHQRPDAVSHRPDLLR